MNRIVRKINSIVYRLKKQLISFFRIKQVLKRETIFLEVGAGNKIGKNGWVTIDLTENCDIFWDLRKGLPFPDESVEKIYSSHFLEHLTFSQGQIFLSECLRVLTPGGNFSICVPNARIYIEAYLNAGLDKDLFCVFKPAFNNTTRIDYVNYIAYMAGYHQYMFDEENLLHLLEMKGFKHPRLRSFNPATDLAERRIESIYAEADKEKKC